MKLKIRIGSTPNGYSRASWIKKDGKDLLCGSIYTTEETASDLSDHDVLELVKTVCVKNKHHLEIVKAVK